MVAKGTAIDLKQVKTFKDGNDKFHTLYDGTKILGTEAAIKAEMADVWVRVRGEEGKRMRTKMGSLRSICEASWKAGMSRQAMESLAHYF